jgi:hypothetical protein
LDGVNSLLVGSGIAAFRHSVEILELTALPPQTDGSIIWSGKLSRPKFATIQEGDELKLILADGRFGMIEVLEATEEEIIFYGKLSAPS